MDSYNEIILVIKLTKAHIIIIIIILLIIFLFFICRFVCRSKIENVQTNELLSDEPSGFNKAKSFISSIFSDRRTKTRLKTSDSHRIIEILPKKEIIKKSESHRSDLHKSDPHKSDLHKSDQHKSDLHKSDLHKSEPHKSDLHKSEPHKSDQHKSDLHKSEPHKSDQHKSDQHMVKDVQHLKTELDKKLLNILKSSLSINLNKKVLLFSELSKILEKSGIKMDNEQLANLNEIGLNEKSNLKGDLFEILKQLSMYSLKGENITSLIANIKNNASLKETSAFIKDTSTLSSNLKDQSAIKDSALLSNLKETSVLIKHSTLSSNLKDLSAIKNSTLSSNLKDASTFKNSTLSNFNLSKNRFNQHKYSHNFHVNKN